MCVEIHILREVTGTLKDRKLFFIIFFLYSQKYTNGLVCQILIKHSSVDRYIGWGYFCAMINNAAIKMDVQVSLW